MKINNRLSVNDYMDKTTGNTQPIVEKDASDIVGEPHVMTAK